MSNDICDRSRVENEPIWNCYVQGYGTFTCRAPSREAAEWVAEQKRQWERANTALVWDPSLPTEFDKLTSLLAAFLQDGDGVVQLSVLVERARLRKLIDEAPTKGSAE